MEILIDILTNGIIIASLSAWLVAQILKLIIYALMEKKIRLERLFGDGGMPSAHTATVISLVVMCGWLYKFNSAIFAVSIIVAIIVMHDATGVRRETGKQTATIKRITDIINSMFADPDQDVRAESLKDFVGHTPLQVFFGSIVGILVAIVYIIISGVTYGAGITDIFHAAAALM